ncbi:hypothetical protein IU433_14275 [Nocardia puris]|uniref:hypothetical protein n=1 Tax=Nocardia puris TaxID=208602 RepID=UPI0018947D19|nr:hypothetical protein [Nocardia puris]MBF6460204.1 hypothetical protein [Nocardia puris]
MRTNSTILHEAISSLDAAAPPMHGTNVPQWDLARTGFGYRVTVFLPENFTGIDNVRSATNPNVDDFTARWIETHGSSALGTVNAMLDLLAQVTAAAQAVTS